MKDAAKRYYIDIEKVVRRIVSTPYYEDEMFATRRWLIENADDVVERPKEADYLLEMLNCKRLDEEQGHILADQILCNLLEELGYHKLVNAFNNLYKWYS